MEYTTPVVKIGDYIVRVDDIRQVHIEKNMNEAYILCFDLYDSDNICINYGHTWESEKRCKERLDEMCKIMGGK